MNENLLEQYKCQENYIIAAINDYFHKINFYAKKDITNPIEYPRREFFIVNYRQKIVDIIKDLNDNIL